MYNFPLFIIGDVVIGSPIFLKYSTFPVMAELTIKYPDYYGVDTPNQNELLASKFDLEGMRKFIDATTLQFLSIEGLYTSMGYEKRNSSYPQFTDHCFTGEYPIIPIDANDKDFVDKQLTFMSSKS